MNVTGKYLSKFELKELANVFSNEKLGLKRVEFVGDASNISDHQRLPLITRLKKIKVVKVLNLYLFGILEEAAE